MVTILGWQLLTVSESNYDIYEFVNIQSTSLSQSDILIVLVCGLNVITHTCVV